MGENILEKDFLDKIIFNNNACAKIIIKGKNYFNYDSGPTVESWFKSNVEKKIIIDEFNQKLNDKNYFVKFQLNNEYVPQRPEVWENGANTLIINVGPKI